MTDSEKLTPVKDAVDDLLGAAINNPAVVEALAQTEEFWQKLGDKLGITQETPPAKRWAADRLTHYYLGRYITNVVKKT